MLNGFLKNRSVAISISESPDMGVLGLGPEHLEDAMAEVAAHLLSSGASLMYGGDLRPGGFTEVLFELVSKYRLNGEKRAGMIRNYFAWPVHMSIPRETIAESEKAFKDIAEFIFLDLAGNPINLEDQKRVEPTSEDWKTGLTSMRVRMANDSAARIVLGGRIEGFKGRLPGILEEAFFQINKGAPLYILGGFGGASRLLLKLLEQESYPDISTDNKVFRTWNNSAPASSNFQERMRNGLDLEDNLTLANTVHADEAVALIIRGLRGVFEESESDLHG